MTTPLNIGIDARKLVDFGIGRYLRGLLSGFASLATENRFVLFLPERLHSALPEEVLSSNRFRTVDFDAPLYSFGELVAFRGLGRRWKLDLIHFPHYVRALGPGCRVAVTIHDAIHLSPPASWKVRTYARCMMTWSARSADSLFTVSNAARDDLSRQLHVPAERFVVTPNAADEQFTPPRPEEVAAFVAERSLPQRFLLIVASHRAHKNLDAALLAVAQADRDLQVVIPARDGLAEDRLQSVVRGTPDVSIVPNVSDADLRMLYAAAEIVLLPSRAEGFGLPGLEVAACGGVALASGIPAHREVLGAAAAYSESPEPEDLARALADLTDDARRRATLRAAGPLRAAEFSWKRTAERTLAGYRGATPPSGDPLV